jgi:hypothetical protein
MGRSDSVRRAMSKKDANVMNSERRIFLYGSEESGVEGAIKRGVDEKSPRRYSTTWWISPTTRSTNRTPLHTAWLRTGLRGLNTIIRTNSWRRS